MFKNIDIKKMLPTIIVVGIIIFVIWYLMKGNKKNVSKDTKDNIKNDDSSNFIEQENGLNVLFTNPLPEYYNLVLKIDTKGKKAVFPFQIIKRTKGAMELPNRRSLLNKDIKYKYLDVMQNDKINVVALINLSYTVDHFAFNDDFLLTDKDYLLAYSQAVQHFELV
jgi:hypothetical protein